VNSSVKEVIKLENWLIIKGKKRMKDFLIFASLLAVSIVMAIYAVYLFYISINNGETKYLSYNETSNLNYKVWLKSNDFYSEKYLGENYDVVASAIDNIEINFDYLLKTSDYVQGKSYYKITSYIQAYQKADETEKKVWNYEKVIKDKTITKYDKNTLRIQDGDSFKIDYQAYRKLMDDYKSNYAVSLVGNLVVEIEIKSDLTYKDFNKKINMESRKMSVVIPLTDSIISIDKNTLEDTKELLSEKKPSTVNYLKLCLSIIGIIWELILIIILGIDLVKLLGIDSKYVKELHKILKTYDSVIVNVEAVKLDNENVMYVDKFEELLDAQSEFRVPILYCNVINNKEAMFVIKHDNDAFVYQMKNTLYESEKK
jgi:hypothetical protein